MRIQLFDEADRSDLERTIARGVARGIVSAIRTLARDGWLPSKEAVAQAVEKVVETITPEELSEPVLEQAAAPVAPSPPAAAPPPQSPPVTVPAQPVPAPRPVPPLAALPNKKPRNRHDLSILLRTVASRPDGYVSRDEMVESLRKGGTPAPDAQLSQWIAKQEVDAIIVRGYGKPTKGLKGRLCVLKSSVMQREQRRQENAKRKHA